MRTLRHAAQLLSQVVKPGGLLPLAAALGFDAAGLVLDAGARESLHLPEELDDALVVRGRGALRALVIRVPAGRPLRPLFAQIAAALCSRTAHVLWIVFAASDHEAGISCWSLATRPPRVAALLVRATQVLPSDAETLCALAASCNGDDLLVHARWHELLGREVLSRRFYRTLEQRVAALAESLQGIPPADRAELALLATSRLLFLSFVQAKGWLNGDHAFLANRFDECMAGGGGFHQRVLLPLFFGTLNTPWGRRAAAARRFGRVPFLNGGLFTRTTLERRHSRARLADEPLGELFAQLLSAYRFSAREERDRWSEVAIDPEMLGRAFESLMAARERRVSGAFYTPQALVVHVADRALAAALGDAPLDADVVRSVMEGVHVASGETSVLAERLRELTILDPACGSGAFLVHILERMTLLYRATGDTRSTALIRRDVLARQLHGVDVNPTAVWLCELRLWLSVVIDSEETRVSAVPPLPNLDWNVRVGDTLGGESFATAPALMGPSAMLARLRDRYARATGPRKDPLRRALARDERRRALATLDLRLQALTSVRRELVLARRTPDLFGERDQMMDGALAESRTLRARAAALRRERQRIADGGALPFSFPSHFAHIHHRGGFGLVVGNPPWVRLHNIPQSTRAALRARFSVFRHAEWDPLHAAPRGRRFAAQVDLAALFVERSVDLAAGTAAPRGGGTVALLLPAKLWRSLSGGGVRRLLHERASPSRLEDWTDAPASFDAAVYPSVLIAARRKAAANDCVCGVRRPSLDVEWTASREAMRLDRADAASPWLLLPPEVRTAFDHVRAHGTPLGAGVLGHPTLGVKCGCNEAFLVNDTGGDAVFASVEQRGRRDTVERSALRPLLRGDALSAWRVASSPRAIVWTHAPGGAPLRTLPAGVARWLSPWRRRLCARTDLRGARAWWMLFRTEGADSSRTRVVWSDFGRTPRAALLAAGDTTVPLNTCYVLPCADRADALAITALLNGPVAGAWLNAIAEPARGGWHRYLAWTVALLPLPLDWPRARSILAPLAESALLSDVPSEAALLDATCRAYRLRRDDVAPLVAWSR